MHQERARSVLALLFVLALVLVFGALFLQFRFDQTIDRERAALISTEREAGAIEVALSDFRAAQYSYFAVEHQDQNFWIRRSADLAGQLDSMLSARRDATTSDDARRHYDAARGALASLADLDSRATNEMANGQTAHAADIVFSDSNEHTQRLRTAVEEAQRTESALLLGRIDELQQTALGIIAGSMGLLLLLGFVVARTRRPAASSPASETAQMIRDLPPPVKVASPAPAAPLPAAKPAPVLPSASPVKLAEAAELCVDLARVIDGRDVPALVQRAAELLEAKGVILWAAETSTRTLRPSLTHGYSAKVVSRLGTLDVDGDNVTSLCYRSMRPQVMPAGSPEASGAIAVPLITPSGCAGVLAAEVREPSPSQDLIAMSRIIAAQFAVLAGPADSSDKRSAAEA